ncbi:hypothetical protein O181_087329 [Austropuccinia psidii MF-1]|uniref:Uncharacterized protein n=1 Tax=Austropuccinia psidii MF-1 TaxID=1389203 RepID=A0A9Q3IPJ9_9BASI|nr:hypothetical protein [Austropuccinia psidii MF-1]
MSEHTPDYQLSAYEILNWGLYNKHENAEIQESPDINNSIDLNDHNGLTDNNNRILKIQDETQSQTFIQKHKHRTHEEAQVNLQRLKQQRQMDERLNSESQID